MNNYPLHPSSLHVYNSRSPLFCYTFFVPLSKLVLEQLLRAELEDVVQLLFGHGARLGAQTRTHHQVGQHHLLLGNLVREGTWDVSMPALSFSPFRP